MNKSPITYWRANKDWRLLLGKIGEVVVSTTILSPPPETEVFAPYPFAMVTVGDQRIEVMGITGESLQCGDSVVFVLRKIQDTGPRGVVFYGLKVQKLV